MSCEACDGSKDSKPIKFFWKDDVFCMGDTDLGDLMVERQLGLNVPKGITDFQVCLDCSELVSRTPEDLPKYEQLINQMLRDIVVANAEQVIVESQLELEETLYGSD